MTTIVNRQVAAGVCKLLGYRRVYVYVLFLRYFEHCNTAVAADKYS